MKWSTAAVRTEGLKLQQAPPLEIPLGFFFTAPLAILAAGGLLIARGAAVLTSHWVPATLAFTHLGTLGFLLPVMMGALYQMSPVVAGSPVPRVRVAHAVQGFLVLGLVTLIWGLLAGTHAGIFVSLSALALALGLFLGFVGTAIWRAPVRSDTVRGMRFALGTLLVVGIIGVWMLHGHGGMRFPGPRNLWIQVHLSIALLGWVGGLISAVSWQVVPMFFLAEPVSPRLVAIIRSLLAVGVLLPLLVLVLDALGASGQAGTRLAALGALPAFVAVWLLHPVVVLRSLSRRRRQQADPSLLFWRAGLGVAPCAALAALGAHLLLDARWGLLLGWLAIWGWAGMIVHGMLTRIVPFLVWFHRFSPWVGRAPVPSVRGLLPERWTRLGFALHLASLVAGVVAIVSREPLLARLAGVLLVATGLELGRSLIHVARQRPVVAPAEPPP